MPRTTIAARAMTPTTTVSHGNRRLLAFTSSVGETGTTAGGGSVSGIAGGSSDEVAAGSGGHGGGAGGSITGSSGVVASPSSIRTVPLHPVRTRRSVARGGRRSSDPGLRR